MRKLLKTFLDSITLFGDFAEVRRQRRHKKRLSDKLSKQYYNLSKTCQIPKLRFLYEKYFGQISNGLFVEVGAFDGDYVSNTSCLADLGWKGYYIEPVPEYFRQCVIRHQKNEDTKVDNLAIGSFDGKVRINISGPFSAIDVEAKNTRDSLIEVEQTTLSNYLKRNAIQKEFELLVIDVEGYEWEVLEGFDIKFWNPKMVIIELHDQCPNHFHLMDKHRKIVNFFENSNYRVVYKDFTNTVYMDKKATDTILK